MKKLVTGIMCMTFLIISGCTFYSGKSLLDDATCTEVDSFLIGFGIYHPNPNQYTRKLSAFVMLRQYKITINDSVLIAKYKDDICRLIMDGKKSNKISEEQWEELLEIHAKKIREIEKRDSIYSPREGITLYLNNGEEFGFGHNLVNMTTIDRTYLGLPLSKGAFSYATGVYHNDSTLNNFIFDFCNQIIVDKNKELLENSDEDAGMRLDIWGDTANAKPIPLLKYRY